MLLYVFFISVLVLAESIKNVFQNRESKSSNFFLPLFRAGIDWAHWALCGEATSKCSRSRRFETRMDELLSGQTGNFCNPYLVTWLHNIIWSYCCLWIAGGDVTLVARVDSTTLTRKPTMKWLKGKWLDLGSKAGKHMQFKETYDRNTKVCDRQGHSFYAFSDVVLFLRSNISPLRSILMRWRSSKWSLEMLGATGVRCRQKTSVTAPPLRWLLRVSRNAIWLAEIPYVLMFSSDPALMCILCNFSCYSCTAGGACRYFVCLQEGVSAPGFAFQHASEACVSVSEYTRGKSIRRLFIRFSNVCECVSQNRGYTAVQ